MMVEKSRIGFGAWQISGEKWKNGKNLGWPPITENQAIELILNSFHAGIDFFDTAQKYGNSETLLGKALALDNAFQSALICTKIKIDDVDADVKHLSDAIANKVDISRFRLKRDYIGIVLIHNPSIRVTDTAIQDALENLKHRGIIGKFGVSAGSFQDAMHFKRAGFGNVLEWNFSLLENRAKGHLISGAQRKNEIFISRSPLFRGIIIDKFLSSGGRNIFADHRANIPQNVLKWAFDTLKPFSKWCLELELSISELSLAYLYYNSHPTTIVPGISKTEHLSSILKVQNLHQHIIEDIQTRLEDNNLFCPHFL